MEFAYCKLEIYVPQTHFLEVREALWSVDAGHIGNYDSCMSFQASIGCWRPLDGSQPYLGEEGGLSSEPEFKLEVVLPTEQVEEAIRAVKAAHPYEAPVINAIPLYRTSY